MPATAEQETSDAHSAQADQATRCEDLAGARDLLFAALCAEHCQSDEQGSQTSTLSVPVASLVAHYGIALWPEPGRMPHSAAVEVGARLAAAPSHAILHCCFRL